MKAPVQQLTFWREAPTMRDVADMVRDGGTEALTEAERRADQARYQEVRCKSAMNRAFGMPFNWTLNPYRGCTHGCHYCYARKYHKQFEMNADDEFASVILVKTNIVDVLRRELRRPSWTGELVALGSATDCYQPIEGRYKLTRGALEVLLEHRNPASVVTKGPMIVRDKELLAGLCALEGSNVYISVPCVDDGVCALLEPGTAPPRQRLRAARELAEAGVKVRILMSPIVPGFSSKPALIERTVAACAEYGVRLAGGNVMHLEEGARLHFFAWLEQERPELLEGYRELYRGKSAPEAYRKEVARIVTDARTRFNVASRPGPLDQRPRPS
jgi:DNA repair photolyase